MAIEDGAILGTLFSRVSSRAQIQPLLGAYERLRLPRATEAQLGSRLARKFQHMDDEKDIRARDAMLAVSMKEELRRAEEEDQGADVSTTNLGRAEGTQTPSAAHDPSDMYADDVRLQAELWWQSEGRALCSLA
jgi:salicylate hydroxylase